jgi:hypothetical protein
MNGIRASRVIFYHFPNLREQGILELISSRSITSGTLDPSQALPVPPCIVTSKHMKVSNMVTSKHMRVSSLAINLVMEMWQHSNNKHQVEDNNTITRCQNLHMGIRINQLSLVRIRYKGWVSRASDHNLGNQCRQINVGEAPSRISLPLDKIRCLSQIMVTRGNSKRSSSQVEYRFSDRGTRMSGCAKHVKYI